MKIYHFKKFLFLLFFATGAFAQDNTQTVTTTVVLNEVFGIQIQEGNTVSFDFTKKEDFDNGIVREKATTIAVSATGKWKVQFDSDGKEYFDSSKQENQTSLPINSLLIKESSSTTYLPLSNNGITLKSSDQRGKNIIYTLDYKAKPDWATPVDSYSTLIRFTISPN